MATDDTSSDTPPQSPLFANAPGASPPKVGTFPGTPQEQEHAKQLLQLIKDGKLGAADGQRGRSQQFLPYLLVRAFTGDHGNRPINQTFWESPDIWTAAGDPSASPRIPPDHGGTVTQGTPNTVYAHVWNLGRAPVTGVRVEFYWFNPSLGISGADANLIGMTRVELAPRTSADCHQLVKCPKAWVPVMENGGHECLVVRVSGFGDQIGPNEWAAYENRHIAQRNVAVVAGTQQMQAIVGRLKLQAATAQTRFEMTQVGSEAKDAVQIVAPKLVIDPTITTHVLANLNADKTLTVVPTPADTPRILPHALIDTPAPALAATATPITSTHLSVPDATLSTLVNHSQLFDQTMLQAINAARAPTAGQAQVVRLAQYEGPQLVGGYTMVVGTPA
ncbi:MAG: hypothetical protein JO057_27925 [Chloroflexi bacterium]|nr:hypothetical protein [Chloroflexota bacterium]